MKTIYSMLCLALLIVGCKTEPDNSVNNAAYKLFAKNSETVSKVISNWENETLDYTVFADSSLVLISNFGAEQESLLIHSDESKAKDKEALAKYDFKLVTSPPILLPGVNAQTKLLDGSVRYYGTWKVTLSATDSTEAKSANIKIYESYDFDEDGKIIVQQAFGDFSGLMMYLNE